MEQHARWWPIVELSMPDWCDPEAVGKGASLSAALSQKAVRRPLLTAAVAEYMGEAPSTALRGAVLTILAFLDVQRASMRL